MACTTSESFVDTDTGGGLKYYKVSMRPQVEREGKYARPSAIDADDTTREEAIGVLVLDVGDVPPYFLHASQYRHYESQRRQQREDGVHVEENGG